MAAKFTPQQREIRRRELLLSALRTSERVGYQNVTRRELAQDARVSEALVSLHFGTMRRLRRDLMRAAVSERYLAVLAQGLAARDHIALDAPEELRAAALAALT